MIQRFLLLSAFVLFSSIIGGTPRSLAATGDAASFISDLGSRALAATQSGNSTAAKQGLFRQLFRQYFDVDACARSALGPYWNNATAQQRQEFVKFYEDYVVIGIGPLSALSAVKASRCWGAAPTRKGSS